MAGFSKQGGYECQRLLLVGTSCFNCPRTLNRISYRYGDRNVRFKPRGEWTAEISDHLLAAGQERNGVVENPQCPLVQPQRRRCAANQYVGLSYVLVKLRVPAFNGVTFKLENTPIFIHLY